MGDRLSKSQIDKLGERLRDSEEVSEEDLALLQRVRAEHDSAMSTVADRLANELGLESGTRLKTVGTIVDKLRREHIRLSQMQDIAGVRLVRTMGLAEQDALVDTVAGLFEGVKVVDRRERPSHGYRAVHVIATVDDRNVEIQVRTELQHLWAQVFERFADRYGRGVRYGMAPEDPEAAVPGFESAAVFVTTWQEMSLLVTESELLDRELMTAGGPEHVQAKFVELQEQTKAALQRALARLSVGESST